MNRCHEINLKETKCMILSSNLDHVSMLSDNLKHNISSLLTLLICSAGYFYEEIFGTRQITVSVSFV